MAIPAITAGGVSKSTQRTFCNRFDVNVCFTFLIIASGVQAMLLPNCADACRSFFCSASVMLSEAKHLWSFLQGVAPKDDQRFFASLRMTFLAFRHRAKRDLINDARRE